MPASTRMSGLAALRPSTERRAGGAAPWLSLDRIHELVACDSAPRIKFWVEVSSLVQAEQVMQAAHAALGGTAIDDPDSGAVSGQFSEPIDDAARATLDKEDLGHGIIGGPSGRRTDHRLGLRLAARNYLPYVRGTPRSSDLAQRRGTPATRGSSASRLRVQGARTACERASVERRRRRLPALVQAERCRPAQHARARYSTNMGTVCLSHAGVAPGSGSASPATPPEAALAGGLAFGEGQVDGASVGISTHSGR